MGQVKLKRGLSSNLTSVNLAGGEPAYTTDTKKLYIGNEDGTKTLINPEITEATQIELNKKVDKVDGKGLSSNDYDATEKANANVAYDHSKKTSGNPHGVTKSDVGLGNVENKSSVTIRGELTSDNVKNALGYTPLNPNLKGVSSGLAELDSTGKVPSSQLPSFVDDVLEYAAKANFPATGETGKIYVDISTNITWRWGGSNYVEISPSIALGETSSTAYRGDRGKTAYDHSQKTSGNPHGVTKSDVGLGNVENTSDANKPISNAVQAALNLKANITDIEAKGYLTGNSIIDGGTF